MKTITMMQLRKSPGEYAHLASRHGESFLVTAQGKPVFKIVPVADTVILSDGTIIGPKPLTMGLDLGGEYAQ
jgi:antitoxin (DNA-binding transcriptional repressor) of toxin-antitoxin stability system